MSELPEWMFRGGKPRTPVEATERLLRRFHPSQLDGRHLEVDAIRMPDVSVMRECLCPDRSLVLVDPDDVEDYSGWGIAGFKAGEMPDSVNYNALPPYHFKVHHVPLENNYLTQKFAQKRMAFIRPATNHCHLKFTSGSENCCSK